MVAEPLACVIGDMDLVRPLALAGIRSVAAGPTGPETRWSRHTAGFIELPDLWDEPEAAVDALIEFARTQEVAPVLFYQKDPAVLAISRHRDRLARHFRFVVPEAQLVEDLVDKERFRELAMAEGLPVPPTVIGTAGTDPAPVGEVPFPVAVKPALRNRPNETWVPVAQGQKAIRCDRPGDLSDLWGRPELRGVVLLVQQYIGGDERRICSYHAFIDDTGRTIASFTGRKIRTWPLDHGQSTAVEIVHDPEAASVGRTVLSTLNFRGVAKVDLKADNSGRLHLLEVNPRFSLWHHPGAVAGVNIPEAVYLTLTGRPVPPSGDARSGVRWCQVWGDRRAARASGMGTLEWTRFAASADARRAAHVEDPGSMAGALAYGVMKAGRNARTDESAGSEGPDSPQAK
jgi:predicted ATP-grasp superfamily ATP-dependent carboligase